MAQPEQRIAAVRRFNRRYTRTIGALREGLLDTRFSLAEARVLYELAQCGETNATELNRELDIDAGYLSRILRRFEQDRLIQRTTAESDRRQSLVSITKSGREAFGSLEERTCVQVGSLLGEMPEQAQTAMVTAMGRIETLLPGEARAASPWLLRDPRPGDIGWVISRHGALYSAEYGYNHRFEALVAKVAGGFLESHDPKRERCWIAERDGVNIGSVFMVRESDELARLRLLIVEPAARGLGVGKRLVEECIGFARSAGYRRITLWTNDVLTAARGIYAAAGFRMVSSEPDEEFGPRIVSEDWELDLYP
jgi:DNA-binding MarR family transcriptional regulator/GNAT superfamily N-acetyltransferase